MDPITLQRQIRHNSNDVLNFCEELKQWGAEMKRKDESLKSEDTEVSRPKNKIKKTIDDIEPETEKQDKPKSSKTRIKSSDYAAWEKFDVEAACAKLGEEKHEEYESPDLTDEYDEESQTEAIYEKEKGNKYVKQQNWNEAIRCYTKAIECYGYDPIFYANRALCYIKMKRYREAETDCTTSLRLDKTYVKAYQRRAAAREALHQLTEAHSDLLKVFDYEPNNKESKDVLSRLEKKLESFNKEISTKKVETQRPKSKFTISRQERKELKNVQPTPSPSISRPEQITIIQEDKNKSHKSTEETKSTESIKVTNYWPSGNDVELIKKVHKQPHFCSKKSLKRVNIVDIQGIKIDVIDKINVKKESKIEEIAPKARAWPSPNERSSNKIIDCDKLRVVERNFEGDQPTVKEKVKMESKFNKERSNSVSTSNKNVTIDVQEFNFSSPQTSVQFSNDWRLLKNESEFKFNYLKQVNPKKLGTIFKESLECDIFSGIIHILAEMFMGKNLPVYEYLLGLCEVKRFSMLIMFTSDEDKKDLLKLFDYMKSDNFLLKADVDNLMNKYGI